MSGRYEVLDDKHCDPVAIPLQGSLHDFRMLGVDIASGKSGLAGEPLISIAEIMNLASENHQLG